MSDIKKTTNDYVQVTRGYMRDMRELSQKSNAAFQVLWLFTERMNRSNAVVISQAAIAEILGLGRTTVHKAVTILKEERWVQIVKIGTANAYVINSKIVWRASNKTGKRLAVFHADIVATESEQKQSIESWDDIELKQIPVITKGEKTFVGNDALPPPDQLDMIEKDPQEVSPIIEQSKEEEHRNQLEKRGQKRIDEQ